MDDIKRHERTISRFWEKVEKRGPDDCWLWQTHISEGGYGQFYYEKTNTNAHRIAWILTYGAIPDDLFVLHNCDSRYPIDDFTSRRCVNPSHLRLGTHDDNMDDRNKKGRVPFGLRNGAYTKPERRPKGEKHGSAKLTEAQVREIFKLRFTMRYQDIAEKYGVSKSAVNHIVRGDSWKEVPRKQPPSLPVDSML